MYSCSSCDPKIMIKADGQDQNVTGSPYMDTLSVKETDPTTIGADRQERRKDVPHETLAVSADGKTLTEMHEGHPAASRRQTVNWTGTYERVSEPEMGANMISGQWKVQNYTSASNNVLTFQYATAGDGLKFKANTGE